MKLPNDPLAKSDNAQKPLYVVPFWTLKEAKTAALETAEGCGLRFDNLRFMLHFPAFDLKFTNCSDKLLHGYRNVIDVADLDELLLCYRKRINRDESSAQADRIIAEDL